MNILERIVVLMILNFSLKKSYSVEELEKISDFIERINENMYILLLKLKNIPNLTQVIVNDHLK